MWPRRGDERIRWPRVVPAASLPGVELIHLGGGESFPCPDAEGLPFDPDARRAGLGTSRLALPPARVHVVRDAVVHPGSRVVTDTAGHVVAESVTSAMVGRTVLDETELRRRPVEVDGTVAVFRSPVRSMFQTLLVDLPRAGLLIHPALARVGPLDLLHDGPLAPLEAGLLEHLGSRRVTRREVPAGQPLHAERVVIPNYVTRSGAGAVPSWYRRWSDGVALETLPGAPRRILLHRSRTRNPFVNRAELTSVLDGHSVEVLDVDVLDPMSLLGVIRNAELIVGRAADGLPACLFSRAAHVVELLNGTTIDPAVYYLAVSTGLPYAFVPARRPPPDGPDRVEIDVEWLDRVLTGTA